MGDAKMESDLQAVEAMQTQTRASTQAQIETALLEQTPIIVDMLNCNLFCWRICILRSDRQGTVLIETQVFHTKSIHFTFDPWPSFNDQPVDLDLFAEIEFWTGSRWLQVDSDPSGSWLAYDNKKIDWTPNNDLAIEYFLSFQKSSRISKRCFIDQSLPFFMRDLSPVVFLSPVYLVVAYLGLADLLGHKLRRWIDPNAKSDHYTDEALGGKLTCTHVFQL